MEGVERRATRFANNLKATALTIGVSGLINFINGWLLSEHRRHRRKVVFNSLHHNSETVKCYIEPHPPVHSSNRRSQQYLIAHSTNTRHQRPYFIRTGREWNKLTPESNYLMHRSLSERSCSFRDKPDKLVVTLLCHATPSYDRQLTNRKLFTGFILPDMMLTRLSGKKKI